MRAELRDLTFSAKGKQILSLTLEGDFREKFDELNGKPLEVEIKRYRKKRSKNANDYLWTLCTKIAENRGIRAPTRKGRGARAVFSRVGRTGYRVVYGCGRRLFPGL